MLCAWARIDFRNSDCCLRALESLLCTKQYLLTLKSYTFWCCSLHHHHHHFLLLSIKQMGCCYKKGRLRWLVWCVRDMIWLVTDLGISSRHQDKAQAPKIQSCCTARYDSLRTMTCTRLETVICESLLIHHKEWNQPLRTCHVSFQSLSTFRSPEFTIQSLR